MRTTIEKSSSGRLRFQLTGFLKNNPISMLSIVSEWFSNLVYDGPILGVGYSVTKTDFGNDTELINLEAISAIYQSNNVVIRLCNIVGTLRGST